MAQIGYGQLANWAFVAGQALNRREEEFPAGILLELMAKDTDIAATIATYSGGLCGSA